MSWVYLDDHFPDHPKVVAAGGDAAWLFVCGLAYVKRYETEGRIPRAQVPRLTDRKSPERLAGRLVEVGLWVDEGDAYVVHDYHEWNKPSENRRAAARKAAKARWDAERNANASESHSERKPSARASACPPPQPPPYTSSLAQSQEDGALTMEEQSKKAKEVRERKLRAVRDAGAA